MKIIILTQNDPYYLYENLEYFINNISKQHEILGCIVFDVSPFGKKESFIQKAIKTYKVFGIPFFIRYSFKFLFRKIGGKANIDHLIQKLNVTSIKINGNVNSKESIEKLQKYSPDLLVSIAGNQIFKSQLLELAPKGCINLHTALLPKYRGLMPSFWVLKNNEKETGVSVFFVDEGIDSGSIIVQKKVVITPNMTQFDLIKKTKRMGMDAIIESIDKIHKGDFELISNPDEEMTYFSFPTKSDVKQFRKIGKRFY
jgi:methionyl-tRNA formyltransferase